MLQCNFFKFFLGLTTRACWLHLEKVMKNWRSRWKPKRYKATLSQHRRLVCVSVCRCGCVCACVLTCSVSVQCYWRAYSVGDVEKMALLKLAKWVTVSKLPSHPTWPGLQSQKSISEHYFLGGFFFNFWKATWATERVRWRCPVLHALHPRHLFMRGE